MRKWFWLLALAPVLGFGCKKSGETTGPNDGQDADVFAQPKQYFVTGAAKYYVSPSTDEWLPPKPNRRPEPNEVGTLLRGTEVVATKAHGAFVWISSAEDGVGWMQLTDLVPGTGASLATIEHDIPSFASATAEEPLEGAADIPEGTLLIVLGQENGMSHVNVSAQRTTWVRTEMISTNEVEIEVSQSLEQLRYSNATDGTLGPNYHFVNKVKDRFPKSKLLHLLQQEAKQEELPTAVK